MKENAMQKLNNLIIEKNSRICAGLDPTWEIIPEAFKMKVKDSIIEDRIKRDPTEDRKVLEKCLQEVEIVFVAKTLLEYCREYIDAIKDVVPAIKINSAFFEKYHLEMDYYQVARMAKDAGLFVIGDVKRADIGNTSKAYAEAYLGGDSPFDAITINPYFGTDGVMPFLELAKEKGKGVFILVKTSNKSSDEIQDLPLTDGRLVYEAVADLVIEWAKEVDSENFDEDGDPTYPMVGAVVGATYRNEAEELVERMGCTFFLVPGYGAQGATADDVAINFDYDHIKGTGAIVNSSRGIMNAYKNPRWKEIYSEETWAEAAKAEAIRATEEINQAIEKFYKEYKEE